MAPAPLTIVVTGMMAGVPGQGGAAWAVLQYVLGLRRLGHDVWFVEPMASGMVQPAGTELEHSANAAYFRGVASEFGLENRSALLLIGTDRTIGVPYRALHDAVRRADLLLNLSGLLTDEALVAAIPIRAYVDLDPAFTQLWQTEQSIDMRFAGHTHFVTVGRSIGRDGCTVPTCGREWITTPPLVVLDAWPVAGAIVHDAMTTVANWRGYGSIERDGVLYGQKVHALRAFFGLPRLTQERFVLALNIHPDERDDLDALARNGWHLVNPAAVTATPSTYRRFIQESKAEFGIAKSGYVLSRCGWFSDRSVCYLASGRPVIAQDTGFSAYLPTGTGLFAFSSTDEILAAIEALNKDYRAHARAARAIAVEHFDSDRVLRHLLDRLGIPA